MKIAALAFALALGSAFSASAYDPVRQPAPANPGSAYELGRIQVHKGNMHRAFLHFRQAVAENKTDFRAYTLMGYSLRHLGRLGEAVAAYDKAIAIKPDFAEALEYRGIAHAMRGDRAAAMRDYQSLVRLKSPLAEDVKAAIDKGANN